MVCFLVHLCADSLNTNSARRPKEMPQYYIYLSFLLTWMHSNRLESNNLICKVLFQFNDGLIRQTRAHMSCLSVKISTIAFEFLESHTMPHMSCLSVKISTIAFEFLESHTMPCSYNARTADFRKS